MVAPYYTSVVYADWLVLIMTSHKQVQVQSVHTLQGQVGGQGQVEG